MPSVHIKSAPGTIMSTHFPLSTIKKHTKSMFSFHTGFLECFSQFSTCSYCRVTLGEQIDTNNLIIDGNLGTSKLAKPSVIDKFSCTIHIGSAEST